MRLKLKLTDNNIPIPINNQHIVNSYIHKCLGKNNMYHDSPSNYCVTNIRGGKLNKDKESLKFNGNAHIIITSSDNEFLGNLMSGIIYNTDFGYGMGLNGYENIHEELYDEYNIFRTLTPILLRKKINNKNKFITIEDNDFVLQLKNQIINKFSKIDNTLKFDNFDIQIRKHNSNKTKMIKIRNTFNIASQCDIIVKCNNKLTQLLYNYGIGQSTGSGFGTIYNSENHHLYY